MILVTFETDRLIFLRSKGCLGFKGVTTASANHPHRCENHPKPQRFGRLARDNSR